MSSKKSYKFEPCGFSIFCDDIRREDSGKSILIGVYGVDMFLNAPLPLVLPGLKIMIHYFEPVDDPFETLSIQLAEPNEDFGLKLPTVDVPKESINPKISDDDISDLEQPRRQISIEAGLVPFHINSYGRLRVQAVRNGKKIPLGSLNIQPREKLDARLKALNKD